MLVAIIGSNNENNACQKLRDHPLIFVWCQINEFENHGLVRMQWHFSKWK